MSDFNLASSLPSPNLPAHERLDLRGTPCPINFVKTKLRLEKLPPGALLEVWLDAGEPIEQVPDSLTMEGYVIEQVQPYADSFLLHVRKPAL